MCENHCDYSISRVFNVYDERYACSVPSLTSVIM